MITAIISEFNPFTNGHKHIIDCAKENGDFVIALMSGNFVQRGELAIINKHARAKMAIEAGVHMVLELPVQFSLSQAETFANGAVMLLSKIPTVHKIIFGSESGDIDFLKSQANFCESEEYKKELKKSLKMGNSFSKADYAAKNIENDFSKKPNDILGIEYLRAIEKYSTIIQAVTIPRIGSSHDSETSDGHFASASFLREKILAGKNLECTKYMPQKAYEILHKSKIVDSSSLGILSSYASLMLKNRNEISEVSEGLENLLFQNEFIDFDSYAKKIKSKRYTLSKIKRMSIKNVLNIAKKDVKFALKNIDFLRVLAVDKKYVGVFSTIEGPLFIKRASDISLLSKKQRKILKKMEKADMIYSIFSGSYSQKMIVV